MDAREVEALAAQLPALGASIGLGVDPAYRLDVAWYLAELLEAAARLAELPLADDVEPAPTFEP